MSKYILPFNKIDKNSVAKTGGKGASLGEMTQAKIKVPPGYVLLASAFDRFLEETDIGMEIDAELKKLNYDDVNAVDNASRLIRSRIECVAMPQDLTTELTSEFKKLKAKFVAVRSSATAEDSCDASWAGELDTFLNVTSQNLIQSVQRCWSSLFTARAIFYRHEKKLTKTRVSVAVVVQTMVQADLSGAMFTVHPVTQQKTQMIIEAGYGLGESIVSGLITPDSYVVDKTDWSILDINIGGQSKMIVHNGPKGTKEMAVTKAKADKQKLTGKQIIEVAKQGLAIEEHYGWPCDIEWSYADDVLYILQARPITTL